MDTETKPVKPDTPEPTPVPVANEVAVLEICRDGKDKSHFVPFRSVYQIVADERGLIVEHLELDGNHRVARVSDLSQIKIRSATPEALLKAAKAEVARRAKLAK